MTQASIALVSLCSMGAAPSPYAASDEADRPSDTWITVATKLVLVRAQGVDGAAIDADAVDGVVLLHGMVGSEAEKTRASVAARRVPGVRQVRNVLTVVREEDRADVALADALLAEQVSDALSREPALRDGALALHAVNDGIAILAGVASTPGEHRRAVALAGEVPGVRRVASLIRSPDPRVDAEIWERTGPADDGDEPSALRTAWSDAWIQTRLKFRLLADPGLSPTRVDIDAREGIVTLFGIVESHQAKQRAEERSLEIDGVLLVDNELQVVPRGAIESVEAVDAGLAEEIERRLETEPLEEADISVDVCNATVRLKGSVASSEDRMTVLVAAGSTQGVRAVSDGLEVRRGSRG